MKTKNLLLSVATALLLTACGNSTSSSVSADAMDTKEKLGESLFFDQNLSKTRNTSCATCHDPKHAFIDARFIEAGRDQAIFIDGALSVGDDGFSLGGRNAPTAAYAMFSPTFDAKKILGGQFHDGRAATLKDQAMGPPLDGAEMQMPNRASVIERIKENPKYVEAFKALYGDKIFEDTNASYEAMGEAIGNFEKTDLFAPFDSKYDRLLACSKIKDDITECYIDGGWTRQEQLGESLFFSNNNTNCKTCHQLKSDLDLEGETFTNYTYENIGTPKNLKALLARVNTGNATDANAVDLGVGKTIDDASKNGMIKVPTLRNIAITGPYMSNGVFKDLKTVLEFYDHMGDGDRPNNPETGKPWGEPDVESTINRKDLKMDALTDKKIEALEAFLETLTDKRYEHLIK